MRRCCSCRHQQRSATCRCKWPAEREHLKQHGRCPKRSINNSSFSQVDDLLAYIPMMPFSSLSVSVSVSLERVERERERESTGKRVGSVGPKGNHDPRPKDSSLRRRYLLALQSKVGQADSDESSLEAEPRRATRSSRSVTWSKNVSYAQVLRRNKGSE
jgi:hypothetical protein